jgi:uncharacterized protein YjbI with pentapeptide repeats
MFIEVFMANEEQLQILKQGVDVWNKWREENRDVNVDFSEADLIEVKLTGANLNQADIRKAKLSGANLSRADLSQADLSEVDFFRANLSGVDLRRARLTVANLSTAYLYKANLGATDLTGANLARADLSEADLRGAILRGSKFLQTDMGYTLFGNSDLSETIGLQDVVHTRPSSISTDTFVLSKGKIAEAFLRGCGLPDWEIEGVKLHNPELSNEDVNKILYKMYDLRATQALQISPLFISYNHADNNFVNQLGSQLTEMGIRYWRDIKDLKAGRVEKQLDRAISQNPTVLIILSEHSLRSDWVEHEVRMARSLEKDTGRDVLCPVALDDSWKSSRWPKRIMEQIMEYNILDFSTWEDDSKFESMFRKLIDGLELFYKG